jgi:hypothetical protein
LTAAPKAAVPIWYVPAAPAGAVTWSWPIGPRVATHELAFTPLHTRLPQLMAEATRCVLVSTALLQFSPVALSSRNWS